MPRVLLSLLTGLLLVLQTTVAVAAAPAAGDDHEHPPTLLTVPAADPARGVVTADLRVATEGPCLGALEVLDDRPGASCTHGPDPAPAEIADVRTADTTPEEGAEIVAAAPPFSCDGDGTSGRRAHAIYAYGPDRESRYDTYASTFKAVIAEVQDDYRRSSYAHGADDPFLFRFTHTTPSGGTCEPIVDEVRLPSTADDDTFSNTINALTDLGYTDPSRRYLVFVDANVLCGIAQLYPDDRASPSSNWNNVLYAPLFARVDAGCWSYAATHEMSHTIGAVQDSAPHATGAGHCNDDHDIMCYADGGPTSARYVRCGDTSWEQLLDCGGDDYFHPDPPSGSYLAGAWNTADSGWLFRESGSSGSGGTGSGTGGSSGTSGGGSGGSTGGGSGGSTSTSAPTVRITAPGAGVTSRSFWVRGTAADKDGDLRSVKLYVDGRQLASRSTSGSWSVYVTLAPGKRTLMAKAVDSKGRVSGAKYVEVTVLADLPRDLKGRFKDDDRSVFENDIARLAAQGVTTGCNSAGTMFCPNDAVTRGQMAAFLVRALNLTNRGTRRFSDDNNSVFEQDIEKLAAAGITSGCNSAGTKFCPNDTVTRGQMAAFLVRALGLTDRGSARFIDDNRSIFQSDIEKLATAGITTGCNSARTKFCPYDSVTRGQMAAFLNRALYS